MADRDLAALRQSVAQDPGGSAFYELASALCEAHVSNQELQTEYPGGILAEALFVLIRGIGLTPSHLKARLLLAKVYYLQSLPEFAVRELVELYRQSRNDSVRELLESFGEVADEYIQAYGVIFDRENTPQEEPSEVLAEIKLEQEFDDALDNLEESKPDKD